MEAIIVKPLGEFLEVPGELVLGNVDEVRFLRGTLDALYKVQGRSRLVDSQQDLKSNLDTVLTNPSHNQNNVVRIRTSGVGYFLLAMTLDYMRMFPSAPTLTTQRMSLKQFEAHKRRYPDAIHFDRPLW